MVVVPSQFQSKILQYLGVSDLNDLVLYRQEQAPTERRPNPPQTTVKFSSLYVLHKILGAGGFGVVCEVTNCLTQKKLAIKITRYNSKQPSSAALSLMHE